MPLSDFQRRLCRLLSEERKRSRDSYVAGGLALNEVLAGRRRSHDIDLFHDAEAALAAAWASDRATLSRAGLTVQVLRERPSFVEAHVSSGPDSTLVQWVQDSAYRFFPLVEHPDLGLTLHPVDLATNKLLAVAGRREARDWIDILHCHESLQPLGYLAWAASGKDPGLGPLAIIEEAARSARYTQAEVDGLQFDGPAPDVKALSARWHQAIAEAREIIALLPPEQTGKLVLHGQDLETAGPELLRRQLPQLTFHEGRLRGAFPEVRSAAVDSFTKKRAAKRHTTGRTK
ncbi:MAG: hypothetical protein HY901_31375 [Deltaproteobacteria bacterium]|nr:hypothetical protein [Deltaproteobacteria bacterium]